MDAIDVYISFKDNTQENGDSSISEVLIKTLPKEIFEIGDFDLPRVSLSITQDEALEKLNLIISDLHFKDQF